MKPADIAAWAILPPLILAALALTIYTFFLVKRTNVENGGYIDVADTTEALAPPLSTDGISA